MNREQSHLTVVRTHSERARAAFARALEQVGSSVPECVAAGFIEMKTGQVLDVVTFERHQQTLANRIGDPLWQCRAAGLEPMFLRTRPSNDVDDRYFREVLVLSNSLIHLFQRCGSPSDVVLMTVWQSTANLESILDRLRRQLPALASTVLD